MGGGGAALGLRCRDVRTREVGIQDIHHKVRLFFWGGKGGGFRELGLGVAGFCALLNWSKCSLGLRCRDVRTGGVGIRGMHHKVRKGGG